MKYLFDENLPQRLADALANLGLPVEHVQAHDLAATPDQHIFEYCRQNGYALVSADLRIHRDKAERTALEQSGIGVVEINLGNLPLFEQAKHFLDRAPDLAAILKERPPFHYVMTQRSVRSKAENDRRRRN